MLLRTDTLEEIVAGRLRVVYRRWTRPTVRQGTVQRTARGLIEVEAITQVDPAAISDEDAAQAGLPDADAVRAALPDRPGDTFRITLRYAGPDPRLALREQAELSAESLDDLRSRLARMDGRSPRGPWTWQTLTLIADNPGVRAAELCQQLSWDKPTFKRHVRSLKELGLTISLERGYQLSPRGSSLRAAGPSSR